MRFGLILIMMDGNFTLNSLDLRSTEELARGKDYHRRDAFYRFNQTFQEYFDNAAKIETTFPARV